MRIGDRLVARTLAYQHFSGAFVKGFRIELKALFLIFETCPPLRKPVGHSHKSFAFGGGRDAARFGFAPPLVPMASNIIVDGITKGSRNDDTEIE